MNISDPASPNDRPAGVEQLLATTDLANALESDRFKQFLDHIPIAIAVAELTPEERIVYANIEFERLTSRSAPDLFGKDWSMFPSSAVATDGGEGLSEAIALGEDFVGTFELDWGEKPVAVDVWSNLIQDDGGEPVFRLVALAEAGRRADDDETELQAAVREKDTLLRELQHRVTNNLQMITALIRLESRTIPDDTTTARFDRLAGRIEALGLLYRSLSETSDRVTIDLGVYLSEIASAVMRAHAVEGIHLDLQVDTWPVSVNVAMPAGLVVNELLTNALKHAFTGRSGGTISLHSLVDPAGCRVTIADDGIGLAVGTHWPKPGKLSAMIVQSLRQNAKATLDVESTPGNGMRVTIFFARADANE
ncbi:two-component sensor histidine kinase [Sphingomonas sp. BE270]|jgi:two-component sensor histidine kinase|uniref:sensor histidine kinase n=1 Tax=unclassified Sphingomonas TaxID=196159 RepID=UPI0010F46878|nr:MULTISPECIES: histidine kinase dimerization/phosphoacceptor domain -containing protein [unclassified Sphingomonas]MDR7258553.1 two-component sensor histidine kinase [Sphingomonas sp. BE270]